MTKYKEALRKHGVKLEVDYPYLPYYGVIEDLTSKEDKLQYYLRAGYMWLRLTNKQCNDLRDTLRGLKLGIETEDGLKVGNWLLKN